VSDEADDQLFRCPAGSKHFFARNMKQISKPSEPFTFMQNCRKCTALLLRTIVTKADKQGNRIPTVSAFLVEHGVRRDLPTHIYRLIQEHLQNEDAQPA
jgi:hypothetical protein